MPLPIRSGLPIHINGSFAITSNRKYICQQNEDDKFDMRPVWNRFLMQDAVCGAYIRVLLDIAHLLPVDSAYNFHSLWPNPRLVTPLCEPLVKGFYRELTASDSVTQRRLFYDGKNWADIRHSLFVDFDYISTVIGDVIVEAFRHCVSAAIEKKSKEVEAPENTSENPENNEPENENEPAAVKPDIDVVSRLPDWAAEAFKVAEVQENVSSNTYDIVKFFRVYFLPNIDCVKAESRDKILLEALRRNDEKLNQVSCLHLENNWLN